MRLAKIDADEHSSVKGGFGIQGFPTILFFSKGQQIKYSGGRSKEVIINWLNKKTKPSVTIIEPSQVDELASNGKVNILLHTDESAQHDEAFSAQANVDDYNSIFFIIELTTVFKEVTKMQALLRFTDLLEKFNLLPSMKISKLGSASTKDPLSIPSMRELSQLSLEKEELL